MNYTIGAMNTLELAAQLEIQLRAFRQLIGLLNEAEFLDAAPGKWSAGQQLDHLCRSVAPLNLAFRLPDFVLRMMFGSANRPSKSYEALVEKYQSKLAEGGRASGRFIPGPVAWKSREKYLARLEKSVIDLKQLVMQLDDSQLDSLLLPHPLLGKLTLREMLYFTLYHVQHHQQAIWKSLKKTN